MLILNSPEVVQETALRWKREQRVALVPTMGCLHSGHVELVRRAKQLADRVIVSIFVNPLQFAPGEDFEKYPRVFGEDCALLDQEGVDLVFNPSVADLYPQGFQTRVSLGDITKRLCGAYREGHFDGVATVCLKLFEISQADFAVFGKKDFQQLRVIQTLVSDLNLPIKIIPHDTVRETDGLAMSSRNRYLSNEERVFATAIPEALNAARSLVLGDATSRVKDVKTLVQSILSKTPLKPQYVELTESRLLIPAKEEALVHSLSIPHLFIAAFAGTTRLIDNISLNGEH